MCLAPKFVTFSHITENVRINCNVTHTWKCHHLFLTCSVNQYHSFNEPRLHQIQLPHRAVLWAPYVEPTCLLYLKVRTKETKVEKAGTRLESTRGHILISVWPLICGLIMSSPPFLAFNYLNISVYIPLYSGSG